jgi:hypothetical protein
MALISCWECGNKVSSLAEKCPKCGFEVIKDNREDAEVSSEKASVQKKLPNVSNISWMWGVGILVCVILAVWYATSYNSGLTTGVAKSVIERSDPFSRINVVDITRISIDGAGTSGIVMAVVSMPDNPNQTFPQEFYFTKYGSTWGLSR